MGNCIICGTSTEGPICETHQEDVVFEFKGNSPSQLTPGRYYRGTVDGYADFGVFVDIGDVTGLLHRSKLDRRLESLEWDVGDAVFVQVNNVRDNDDIDLGWSIRQSEREFRGVLVDAPDGDYLLDEEDDEDETEAESEIDPEPKSGREPEPTNVEPEPAGVDSGRTEPVVEEPKSTESTEPTAEASAQEPAEASGSAETRTESAARESGLARETVESLRERVGDVVRLEGEIASVRQTSGPTVFEFRDETGVVDCAAFLEAGARAYPEIEADDVVRLDGEVRLRRDEIQIETESLVALEGDARGAVVDRMDAAIDEEASPEIAEPLVDDDAIANVAEEIESAATVIRRAVLESRPVVVRHDATTDGYVAGAAIERAVLPLIEDNHAGADAVYHYFDRRPLEDGVYDMNDATKDVTRMLGDRERHDEKLPLFVFAAAASTAASIDGLDFLEVYDAPRVVLDGREADDGVADRADTLVMAPGRTATTVAATVAAAVNDDIRGDLHHLPAVSYWTDAPEAYVDLAADAGIDEATAGELREAVALEAYYQSYEDKRELIIDLLFEKRTSLATQVAEQFHRKLDAELETATANLDERSVDGVSVTVLDTDAYTHRFDFPPTRLLLDELARRHDADAVVGVGTDELHVRADHEIDVDAMVETLRSAAPNAGVTDPGTRQPKVEFLAGEREAIIEAVVDAVAESVIATSA